MTPFQPFVEALRHHLAHDDAIARELAPILRPELAELARLVPELRRAVPARPDEELAEPGVRVQRGCDAVTALCAAVARSRPLLLVLEDLQWADGAALGLLRQVARATQGTRVTIVVTLRDDEPLRPELRAVLLELLRERALDRIALSELDESETIELVAAQCPAGAVPGVIEAIRAQGGGNPFFVEELVRRELPGGALPVGLRDVVESRLERLPAATRHALAIAAAAGCAFDVATVARAADAQPGAILGTFAQAVRAGVLVADGERPDRFAFRHGLVQRALLALLTRALHERHEVGHREVVVGRSVELGHPRPALPQVRAADPPRSARRAPRPRSCRRPGPSRRPPPPWSLAASHRT